MSWFWNLNIIQSEENAILIIYFCLQLSWPAKRAWDVVPNDLVYNAHRNLGILLKSTSGIYFAYVMI